MFYFSLDYAMRWLFFWIFEPHCNIKLYSVIDSVFSKLPATVAETDRGTILEFQTFEDI